ncbi:MAG: beta-glucosidase [Candidatus Magnetoglobus multicellularis str. Araruama]|uniref:beta-glucosidase n=1 Tax=Candidatus Magnetoglobus multicellularis str. Araruama TaxID=890399 RepID=A0A1V1PCC3_9BACT|nr:MAG: beta-glucosidase [Candidatus Magnetoglobus multicellularis str. Araruama]
MSDIENKVNNLISKMNLDQKVGQVLQVEREFITPEEVKTYHIGSLLSGGGSTPGDNMPEDWIQMNDELWAASMEENERYLAIPVIYGVDAIHGHGNAKGAVIFPHNIGLGAANDPDLIERIAMTTARETAATGVDWTFAPTLAVVRNDHWGRTYESYAEVPEIVTSYAARFVKGLQGNFGEENVIACAKHFIADGATLHGVNTGDAPINEAELRKIHLPPYLAALKENVLTVMISFSSWNYIKCHANKYLITHLLKEELGFDGIVITDWDGIDYLSDDYFEAVAIGINAGMDMFMVTERWKLCYHHLKTHIQTGRVAMSRLDDAVRRILRVKYKAGIFDKPRPAQRILSQPPTCMGSSQHRETAREAVRKSLVLLKNNKDILPLNKDARIIVAGKSAHSRGIQCGGFTIEWQGVLDNDSIVGGTSIWEGISKAAPNASLSENLTGEDAHLNKHDVGIVVIGEKPYAEGFGDIYPLGIGLTKAIRPDHMSSQYASDLFAPLNGEESYGTTLNLCELHPEDLKTIQNISSKGIPVIVILISGRPLVVNKELDESEAFVAAWLPGSEGGGVADVLFGDYDFQGKLSFTWPTYDDDNLNIGDDNYHPLFAYGYGLSYRRS